jgi:Acyl-CoA dehydrogenase, C-terminal domain
MNTSSFYCTPSPVARDAAKGLADLLRSRVSERPDDHHFGRDWRPLWNELTEGGWLELGSELAVGGTHPSQLILDLSHVAHTWTPSLIPLPFLEVLIQKTPWPDASLNVGALQTVLVAFPNAMVSQVDGNVTAVDGEQFAPSLPTRQVMAAPDHPERLFQSQLSVVRMAGAVGCAARVLAEVVKYARIREAYGRPIGSYQAIKHLLADMYVELELCLSGGVMAANDQAGRYDVAVDILRRCRWILGRAIQVYGGIGFTWEAGVHFYVRHVIVTSRITEAAQASLVAAMS